MCFSSYIAQFSRWRRRCSARCCRFPNHSRIHYWNYLVWSLQRQPLLWNFCMSAFIFAARLVGQGKLINGYLTYYRLMFIYPSTKSPCFLSFNQYAEVLEAASKYAVEPTIEALRTLLLSPRIDVERNSTLIRPSLAESDPLRAFAIATSMGWRAEIIHCSTLTLRVNLNTAPSSSELENMPTKYYRWLGELHEERRAFFRRLFEEFDDEPSEYRVKKCKECGEDPLSSWWDEYIKRATTSVSSRPLGDRVFDLSMLFPPEQDFDDGRCMACPSTAIPLNTLYALSKLQNKHGKKKDSIRHKFVSNT
ncbi:hypothetical protein FS842_010472 [Serendipita sp. 407]|nr:hypothetical protein FRC15_008842 [Serendipita sp. 397]KAG8803332.1 hypothetical protein FRC16_006077 [Serendipita sp. 398]KAG9056505.1 hypothetical protein FS842_010472 [Serendipita sp. 407]